MEKNMTKGNPMKLILLFAIPILLGNMVQQFYNLADTMIVGRKLGEDALGAVGATGAVVSLLFSFIFGFSSGFSIVISQYYGAGKEVKMRKSIANTYVIGMSVSVLLLLAAHFGMPSLLKLLGTPEEFFDNSLSYIRIVVWGLPVTMLYNIFNSLLKSVGNSVVPLVILGICAVLNVGLDFLFIFGFSLGIPGAATATVLAQCVSVVLCGIYVWKKAPILHVTIKDFTPELSIIFKLLTMGISMSLMLSIVSVGSVILQSGINSLGPQTVTAHTAGRKVLEIIMNPFSAIGAATSTFASQNYGAGEQKRIKRGTIDGIALTAIWSTLIVIVTYIFAPFMVQLITDETSPYVLETAVKYLKISVPFFYALGVLVVVRNVLQGIGQRIVPILASVIEMGGKALVVYLLVPKIDYLAICIAEPSIWLFDGILVLVVFFMVAAGGIRTAKQKKKTPTGMDEANNS